MILYIIGNGFDCYHNLPTKTNDFRKCIEHEDTEEYYLIAGVDWNNYEEGLSDIDVEEICEQFVGHPDYTSDHEYDRDGVIFDVQTKTNVMKEDLDNALHKMIQEAERIIISDSIKVVKPDSFNHESIILSFNYTSTIETLYSLDKVGSILHIHGYYPDNDNLVFGYSEPEKSVLNIFETLYVPMPGNEEPYKFDGQEEDKPEYPDPYVQQQYDAIYELYQSNQKGIDLDTLSKWINPYIGNIDKVVVLGHSMGEVDKRYFETLEQMLHPAKWIISQHDGSPSNELMNSYTFSDKVKFCSIEDYLA